LEVTGDLNLSDPVSARWSALAEEVRRRLGVGVPVSPGARGVYRHGIDTPPALLHRSAVGGRLARAFDASALSIGEHVIGDQGALDPETRTGQALLAHELTHVAYEHGARTPSVQREAGGSFATDDQERQAQRAEIAALRGPVEQAAAGGTELDLDELTERVYRRIFDVLLTEHERAAQIA